MGDPSTSVSESLAEGVEPVEPEVLELGSVSEEVAYITNLGVDSFVIVNDGGMIGLGDNRK